jgi:hypothetical protein
MIDNSDGVDYVSFNLLSEKDAPDAEYAPHDGSIRINLDEIWVQTDDKSFTNSENELIENIIDALGHELNHKWFVWGMGEDWTESFNEQDERVMRCIQDWVRWGKMRALIEYDYK